MRRLIRSHDVTLRLPRTEDLYSCREYIGSLVRERALISIQGVPSLSEEREWLRNTLDANRRGTGFTTVVEIDNQVAGMVTMKKEMKPPSALDHVATIGFGLLKPYRQKGVMEAMIRETIKLAKKEIGLRIVCSGYFAPNTASAALHKKLGFTVIGTVPNGGKFGRSYVDRILVLKKV